MSSNSSKKQHQNSAPKTGGLMSQLLEFFGMTPTVPSEYLNSEGGNEGKTQAQPMWLCKSCHNPTEWIEAEERWQCPSHPKASTFEKS